MTLTHQPMQDALCAIVFQKDRQVNTVDGVVQKWIWKVGEVGMKKQVILQESDIVQTIANSFSVDTKDIMLRHYKETIGYGYSEKDVDRVEITVNLPMNDGR